MAGEIELVNSELVAEVAALRARCRELEDAATRVGEERERLESLNRIVFEQSPDGILIMETGTGRAVEFNHAAHLQLGYDREEFSGLRISDYDAFQKPEEIRETIARVLHEGRADFEVVHRKKDGSLRSVCVTTKLVEISGVRYFYTVFRDISERKRMEEELVRARDAADAANRAKSVFLANMSHEIRTPMTCLMGMAELLRYTPLTDEQERYLDNIDVAAENLLVLINDTLDLSSIEGRKTSLEMRVFDLRGYITEGLAMQRIAAERKGISFSVELSRDIPAAVSGDPHRLTQVLQNLVANAVKYTERGRVLLSVRCVGQEESMAAVEFTVSDTGIGIPLESLRTIFAPFEQLDNVTNRTCGGTGLGLTISSRLVEMMGGELRVESPPGKGSAFSFVVPFQLPRRKVGTNPVPAPPAILAGNLVRVLLVEDNEITRSFLVVILSRQGYIVETAANGEDACDKWGAGAYDLVVMDINLPRMSGTAAMRQIRRREGDGVRTPIIALTAHALAGDREKLLAEGFDGYVPKPVTRGALTAEIRKMLCRKGEESSR
jgi:two-component system, chemotaxis family, CheB/CheR fusion protein